MDEIYRQSRADDTGSLRREGRPYYLVDAKLPIPIPDPDAGADAMPRLDPHGAHALLHKTQLGFGCPITAESLCPLPYYAQYQEDPVGYVSLSFASMS